MLFLVLLYIDFIQIFIDVFDGFGGLSSQIFEELKDEYLVKIFIFFGFLLVQCLNGINKKVVLRIFNLVLSYGRLLEFSNLFVSLLFVSEIWLYVGFVREFLLLIYQVLFRIM